MPEDELPIELGAVSNGETAPVAPTPVLREAARRARDLIDRQARRRGMARRDFLRTAMASAAVLLTLDACSNEASDGRSGGTLRVPEDATVDPDVAHGVLGGDEFVMDVQTHFLELDPAAPFGDPGFPQSSCGETDPRLCYSIDRYLEELFVRSDTDVAVVSAVPAVGENGPLSPARMDEARRAADALCGDGRLLMHGQAIPQIGELGAAPRRDGRTWWPRTRSARGRSTRTGPGRAGSSTTMIRAHHRSVTRSSTASARRA